MILDKMENASKLPAIWQTELIRKSKQAEMLDKKYQSFSTQLNLKDNKENPLILEMKRKLTTRH